MHIRKCLLIAGAVLALAACGTDRPAEANRAPAPIAATTPLSPPVATSPDYRKAVEEKVAGWMRLTPVQIRTQLQADQGATLMNLAKSGGFAQDQLASAILSALNDSADSAARSGTWTAEQANQEKQYWTAQSQADLITEISRWFRES